MAGEHQQETREGTLHASRMTALSHFPRAELLRQSSRQR